MRRWKIIIPSRSIFRKEESMLWLENLLKLLWVWSVCKRHKSIKLADKSDAGWLVVQEYEQDNLADNSEDEKRIKKVLDKTRRKPKPPGLMLLLLLLLLMLAVMTGSFFEVMRLLALSLLFPELVQLETSYPNFIYCTSFIFSVLSCILYELGGKYFSFGRVCEGGWKQISFLLEGTVLHVHFSALHILTGISYIF